MVIKESNKALLYLCKSLIPEKAHCEAGLFTYRDILHFFRALKKTIAPSTWKSMIL